MQSMMLKCEEGGGDDMALPFHQHTFSPLGTFSREERARMSLFIFFFLGQQKFYSCQKTWRWVLICRPEISPRHIRIIGSILSRLNTVLLRNDWGAAACGGAEVRRDSPRGRTLAECVTLPRLVLFVFFFCRQINNSWIFYDCLLTLR